MTPREPAAWEREGMTAEERAEAVCLATYEQTGGNWEPLITAAIRSAVAEADEHIDYITEICDDAGSPKTSDDGKVTVGIVGRVEWMRDRIAELTKQVGHLRDNGKWVLNRLTEARTEHEAVIARAVAAERDRCARVAEDFLPSVILGLTQDYRDGLRDAARAIARAIRTPGEGERNG